MAPDPLLLIWTLRKLNLSKMATFPIIAKLLPALGANPRNRSQNLAEITEITGSAKGLCTKVEFGPNSPLDRVNMTPEEV